MTPRSIPFFTRFFLNAITSSRIILAYFCKNDHYNQKYYIGSAVFCKTKPPRYSMKSISAVLVFILLLVSDYSSLFSLSSVSFFLFFSLLLFFSFGSLAFFPRRTRYTIRAANSISRASPPAPANAQTNPLDTGVWPGAEILGVGETRPLA